MRDHNVDALKIGRNREKYNNAAQQRKEMVGVEQDTNSAFMSMLFDRDSMRQTQTDSFFATAYDSDVDKDSNDKE